MAQTAFSHIKGVFFDLDGTLKIATPSGVDAVLSYLQDYGIPIDPEARRAAYRFTHAYWADRERVDRDLEHFGPDDFWANYIRAKLEAMNALPPGQTPDEAIIAGVNRRFATEYAPTSQLAPGSLDLLDRLKSAGYVLGLVSNRPLPLTETAEQLGIDRYFDFLLAAGQIGFWKPDAGIFAHALTLGGSLQPREAVYVGDNYYADALGAHRAGLHPILIDPLRAFPEAETIGSVVQSLPEIANLLP